VRQIVLYGCDRKSALHVKLRSKSTGRKKTPVHAAQRQWFHVDEEARATHAAGHTRASLESPRERIASGHAHGIRPVDRLRHVRRAVDGLAIVAMAIHIDERRSRELDLYGAAPAFNEYSLERRTFYGRCVFFHPSFLPLFERSSFGCGLISMTFSSRSGH
jgi:hypothetical protein